MTHQRQRANGMLCLLMELMVFVWLLGKISPDKRAAKDDTGELVSGVSIASLGAACGVADARHIARMRYESADEYSVYSFYISLHPPFMDTVVSKGILSTMQYPSVNEVHSVCEHLRESVECGPGRVFVEVGSSVGMVSLYAASRGMQVLAFDPVLPNVERVRESVCLNGRVHCAERNEAGEACIVNTSEWGPYAPGNFRVFWKLVGSASGKRVVQTEPGNLAATMRGGGHYSGEVGMVQLDSVLGETPVELLLLTCQGFEYDVSGDLFVAIHTHIQLIPCNPGPRGRHAAAVDPAHPEHHLAAAPHPGRGGRRPGAAPGAHAAGARVRVLQSGSRAPVGRWAARVDSPGPCARVCHAAQGGRRASKHSGSAVRRGVGIEFVYRYISNVGGWSHNEGCCVCIVLFGVCRGSP